MCLDIQEPDYVCEACPPEKKFIDVTDPIQFFDLTNHLATNHLDEQGLPIWLVCTLPHPDPQHGISPHNCVIPQAGLPDVICGAHFDTWDKLDAHIANFH